MSLDHGVLSMPNRTKHINKDLDKYNAEQAKIKRRKLDDIKFLNSERIAKKQAELNPIKERAWDAYKKHSKAMIDKHGAWLPHKFSSNESPRDFLRNMAKHEPQNFLNIVKWHEKGGEL